MRGALARRQMPMPAEAGATGGKRAPIADALRAATVRRSPYESRYKKFNKYFMREIL